MNQIANSGSEPGNFMFVDTNHGNYQEKITEALGESFDMALGSDSAIKFSINNEEQGFKLISAGEINYAAVNRDVSNEEEKKGEDVDMQEP